MMPLVKILPRKTNLRLLVRRPMVLVRAYWPALLVQVAAAIVVAAWWRPWCVRLLILCGAMYGLAAMSNHFAWF